MSQITLVRHGQAQTGAADEASYDQLCDNGRQQAAWLGAYLQTSAQKFDHIIAGSLNRQAQTAQIISAAIGVSVEEDPRLNELDYFGIAAALKRRHDVPLPNSREGFIKHVPQVMGAWQSGEIESTKETFADFEARINAALADAKARGGRVMLVTSGGVIGMAVRLVLGLEITAFSKMLIQVENTSMHRIITEDGQSRLDTFNATPHLDSPAREAARSYI